jgi:hypothetical protein
MGGHNATRTGDTMTTAKKISNALESWNGCGDLQFSDKRFVAAESDLINTICDAIKAIEGVEFVDRISGSMGSLYFEAYVGRESFTVRVSNHKAGRRGNENVADIVVGDSLKEIGRQFALIGEAVNEILDEVAA